MNKAVLAIIPIIAIAGIAAYALSPYFTESSVDEALPTGASHNQSKIVLV